MEFQIISTGIGELEDDWITLKAKLLSGAKLTDVKQDLEKLSELGVVNAISLWYCIFNVGENEKIDSILNSYPTTQKNKFDALGDIYQCAIDLMSATQETEINELKEKMKLSNIALIKTTLEEPKLATEKEIKMLISGNSLIDEPKTVVEEKLNQAISCGKVEVEDLFDVLAYFIKNKLVLSVQAKNLLNLLANREYSRTLQEYSLQGRRDDHGC